MASVYPPGITFTLETPFDGEAIEAYFTRIEGELLCYARSGDEFEVHAGFLEFYIIDVSGALSRGHRLVDIFEQSQDAFVCFELLFDPAKRELRESFWDGVEDAIGLNILLLQRLEILPVFRNHKLGLQAINRLRCDMAPPHTGGDDLRRWLRPNREVDLY